MALISPRSRGDPSRNHRRTGRVPFPVWLIPLLGIAFLVRVLWLDGLDLWLDEAVSFYISREGPLGILRYTMSSLREHPPGYYLLLWTWMQLAGTSEYALRFLSVMGGMLSIVLAAALVRPRFGARTALLVVVLMAVQPFAVLHSRDARMYTWLTALVLLGVHALLRALDRNRWRDWALLAAIFVVSASFHYLAGLVLISYWIFLALRWRDLGGSQFRFAAVSGLLTVLALVLVAISPGLRATVGIMAQDILRRDWATWPRSLLAIPTQWTLGSRAESLSSSESLLLGAASWLLLAAGVLLPLRGSDAKQKEARQLFALILFIPPVAGAALMLVVVGRHHSGVFGIFIVGLAIGAVSLFRRSRLLATLIVATVLAVDVWAAVDPIVGNQYRPFTTYIEYVQERATEQEVTVYTDPWDRYIDSYYNRRHLRSYYIPDSPQPVTRQDAEARVSAILKEHDRLWLLTKPGDYNPETTERAFATLAFPAEKVWFPDSRAAIHYFGPAPLEQHLSNAAWSNMVRLEKWAISTTDLPAGEALRLQFEWGPVQRTFASANLLLSLYGPDGQIWTQSTGAPCFGLCKVADWSTAPITDRRALYVPSDIPPGDYSLRAMWVVDDSPVLVRASGEANPQQELTLATVRVREPAANAPGAPLLDQQVRSPINAGLALRSLATVVETTRAGAELSVPLQWEITGTQTDATLSLLLEGSDSSITLSQAIGPAWYPIGDWKPGRVVRDLTRFRLPGDMAPGRYAVSVLVEAPQPPGSTQVAVGTIEVKDRPHSFTLPQAGQPSDCAWQEGIRLARVSVPGTAVAGEALKLTLFWQASGPASKDWKIFLHLVDAKNVIQAQRDGYPMGGGASTLSWQPQEVVTDEHLMDLPPDLPAGDYRLVIGLYEEKSDTRLLRTDGSDFCVVPAPVTRR